MHAELRECETMKGLEFTTSQKQRLIELGGVDFTGLRFASELDRDMKFMEVSVDLERKSRRDLQRLLKVTRQPALRRMELEIVHALAKAGFTEVLTPIIIPAEFMRRMGIAEGHNLWNQIFWLDSKRCLRPMLAPNLYHVMRQLRRISRPVSIFEVGPCFRRESSGREHAEEFTMLNAVELAPEKDATERLKEIVLIGLKAAGISNYKLEKAESEVYGETIDVTIQGVEVASAATGPHRLDKNWEIFEPWAGVGFGLERVTMISKGCRNLAHVGRSFSHLDGATFKLT
jgi:pyrrolysyl-tRNA synthetase-like protein